MPDDHGPLLASALAQIEADLARLPPHVTRQLMFAGDDTHGLTFGFAARVGDSWRLSVAVTQKLQKIRPGWRVGVSKSWT